MRKNTTISKGGAALLAVLVLSCSDGSGPFEESAPQFDDEDIVITYYEQSARMSIAVNLNRLDLPTNTVAMRIDVTVPDGTVTHHDLRWTPGDDLTIPPIEMSAVGNGLYAVDLTIEGTTLHQSMTLLGVRGGTDLAGDCEPGETIMGTDDPDSLVGTEGKDAIYGLGGKDSIWGGDCADILRGGPGNDSIWGEGGNDFLGGGGGYDVCKGGAGLDTFEACEEAEQ